MTAKKSQEYYLRVVKAGTRPEWPKPADELVIGKQSLSDDFDQYWAYPIEDKRDAADLPNAEKVAAENLFSRPLLVIDQPSQDNDRLEIILAVDGHAWAMTESGLASIEENITSVLEFAKDEYGLTVENFLTTKRVSPKVESAVTELEEGEGGEESGPEEEAEEESDKQEPEREEEEEDIRPLAASERDNDLPDRQASRETPMAAPFRDRGGDDLGYLNRKPSSGSKIVVAIPLLTVMALFAGVLFYRDQAVEKFKSFTSVSSAQPTPEPTTAPATQATPTPEQIDRSKYTVRVLNGTTTSGAAAKLAAELKELGWDVIKTGNAEDSDVETSFVRTSAAAAEAGATLVKDLTDLKAAVSDSKIPTSDSVDLEVVIGLE